MQRSFAGFSLLIVLIVASLGVAPRAHAQLAVLDPINLIENTLQVSQQVATVRQLYQEYQAFQEQYADLRVNWKTYLVGRILLKVDIARDPRMGLSAMSFSRFLNPDGSLRGDIETLLTQHYNIHTPGDITSVIQQTYGFSAGTMAMVERYANEYKERGPALDGFAFQAQQYKASRRRFDHLNQLQTQLASLGDRSEMAQMQTIAASSTTIAAQNEAIIDGLQLLAGQLAHQSLEQQSSVQRARDLNMTAIRSARPLGPVSCGNDCMKAW